MESVYIRLGGEQFIDNMVDIFYTKILHDPFVSHFFNDINMMKQSSMQKIDQVYT